jgi:hypothetical protein
LNIKYTYELRNFQDEIISFTQLENKAFWCEHGEDKENAFIDIYKKLQQRQLVLDDSKVAISPKKKNNPHHPDLEINGQYVGELKTKNSPLFVAAKYGINPQYALTMDLKDSFNYQRLLQQNIDVCIYIWVKWEAKAMQRYKEVNNKKYKTQYSEVKEMGGIWRVNFSTLRRHEINNPPRIHWYKEIERRPPEFDPNDSNHQQWIEELSKFEPRLIKENKFTNITADGYCNINGVEHTSGNSSCSYVFDLSNSQIFECLFFKVKD